MTGSMVQCLAGAAKAPVEEADAALEQLRIVAEHIMVGCTDAVCAVM